MGPVRLDSPGWLIEEAERSELRRMFLPAPQRMKSCVAFARIMDEQG
jgi:hypothetical protein